MNNVVLVTGGSSGIGFATAKLFVDHGDKVVITGRNGVALEKAATALPGVEWVIADVSKAQDWERLRDHIAEKYGHLDVLINNAGTGVVIKDLDAQSLEQIQRCIDINLLGPTYGIHYFAPMMKERRQGTIINLSSVCAKHAWEGYSVYAAAKAGVLSLSKSAYTELQKYNIRVTCVIPGAADTNFQVNAQDKPMAQNPDNLQPENVAQVIFDLCSLPKHVVIEETTVWGMSQVIRPL